MVSTLPNGRVSVVNERNKAAEAIHAVEITAINPAPAALLRQVVISTV